MNIGVFLATMCIAHVKPFGYERGKWKTIGAWLLLVLALADIVQSVAQALIVMNTYHEQNYAFEVFMQKAQFSILLFGWSLYIFKSGPFRSSALKRTIKSIIYFLITFLTLASCNLRHVLYATDGILAQLFCWGTSSVLFILILLSDFKWSDFVCALKDFIKPIRCLIVADSQQSSAEQNNAKIIKRALLTLLMLGIFVMGSVSLLQEHYYFSMVPFAFIYIPWFIILFCYFTYYIWHEGSLSGDKVLLLPLLQRLRLFTNYETNSLSMRKELMRIVLPFLSTSVLCPFVSTLLLINDDDRVMLTVAALLCSLPVVLLVRGLILAYAKEWLYNRK